MCNAYVWPRLVEGGYINRSVFIQKRTIQESTLSGFKVMIHNIHVQFLFCNSLYKRQNPVDSDVKRYAVGRIKIKKFADRNDDGEWGSSSENVALHLSGNHTTIRWWVFLLSCAVNFFQRKAREKHSLFALKHSL